MNIDFNVWLQNQLDERGWSQRELVRQAQANGQKVTVSQISRILRGEQEGTAEVIIAIASGLNISRSEIFRLRGWLPIDEKTDMDPRAIELARAVSALPHKSRQLALNAMEPVLDTVRQFTLELQQLETNGHESQS